MNFIWFFYDFCFKIENSMKGRFTDLLCLSVFMWPWCTNFCIIYTLHFFSPRLHIVLLIDLHVCVTETTQSAQCLPARVNACSWTPQGTWCLQTAAKQETLVGKVKPNTSPQPTSAGSLLHPPHRHLGKGWRVPAVSCSEVAARIERRTVKL